MEEEKAALALIKIACMGALCDCGSANQRLTAVEIAAVKDSLSKYQNLTTDYRSQIHSTQEEVKRRTSQSKNSKPHDEANTVRKLISKDLEQIYALLHTIRPLITADVQETLTGDETEVEGLRLRVERCLQQQREDMARLSKAQQDIRRRVETGLENLRAVMGVLGKRMEPTDVAAGKIAVLKTILLQYSALVEEYCQLTNSNSAHVQQILALKSQIESLKAKSSSLQQEISRQETLSRDLNSEMALLNATIDSHRKDLKARQGSAALLQQHAAKLNEKIAAITKDIHEVRDSLLDVKDSTRAMTQKNEKLELEIAHINAISSHEDIQLHIKMLKESIAVMNSRMTLLHTELVDKDRELKADAEAIATLEQKINVNKKANTTDVAEKMISMQATLHDLLSSLGNASGSSDEDEDDEDIDFSAPLE